MKKEQRVKNNHEIASIVNKKQKVVGKNFVIYYKDNNLSKNRFAFSVSKKYGHAFERNKAKRICRNVFRKFINQETSFDFVIVIRNNLKTTNYVELENESKFLMKLI